MDISIIIVNWNTKQLLRDCLKSVFEQTSNLDYEVIVVDNASSDNSADMLRSEFPQIHLLENSKNRGFAAANNQGIAIAKGRYILLLNSDTIVLDNAISKTVSFADAHPKAAVVGCRVLSSDRKIQSSCFMFPSILNLCLYSTYLYKLFPKNKFFGRELSTWWDKNTIREADFVSGCFMLVRNATISEIGVLDERFFMYFEETDWCYRFRQADWKVLFTPEAEIIHFGGGSAKQVAVKMTLLLRGSMLLFFKKHKGLFTYIAACLLIALFFLVRIPYWLLMALSSQKDKKRQCFRTAYSYTLGTWYALTGGRKLYRVGQEQQYETK
ncbi:glycosyltransferase family 2 protein [Planctomycetota bacterium]